MQALTLNNCHVTPYFCTGTLCVAPWNTESTAYYTGSAGGVWWCHTDSRMRDVTSPKRIAQLNAVAAAHAEREKYNMLRTRACTSAWASFQPSRQA